MLTKLLFIKKSQPKKIELAYLERRTPFWKPLLFILPSLAVLSFFTIYPLFVTLDTALHPLANSHKASSATFGFSAFTDVFKNYYFKKAISNSLLYAFLSIPISMIISLVISAAISSLIRRFARGSWQTLFFMPYVTSGVAISLAFAYLFDSQTGIVNKLLGIDTNWLKDSSADSMNAFWVILIHGIWASLAFQILIFTTAMMAVDKNRYKAASIDGAGSIKQFFTITLPSISKTINFIITVGLIGAIKVFPLALFQMNTTNAEQYGGSTLMMFVFKNVSTGRFQIAAASALILVVIAIAFSVVVKGSFNLLGKGIVKGGEIYVQRKVINSTSPFKKKIR